MFWVGSFQVFDLKLGALVLATSDSDSTFGAFVRVRVGFCLKPWLLWVELGQVLTHNLIK